MTDNQHCAKLQKELTALKLKHEKLQQQYDALRGEKEGTCKDYIENIPGLIYICRDDEDFSKIFINDYVKSLTGYEKDSILDGELDIVDLMHPDDINSVKAAASKAIEQKESFLLTYRIRHSSGEWIWVEDSGNPVFQNGELLFICGIMNNINDRKKIEEQLAHEQYLLQALMDNIPDTIYFKDKKSRFIRVNKAQAKMLSVSKPEDAIGKSDYDFFSTEHAESTYESEQRMMKSQKSIINDIEYLQVGENEYKYISAIKVPFTDIDGNVAGMVGISRDITEQKLAEEKIEEYAEELKVLNSTKDKFFSIIAHDLKNPFNALVGVSGMLIKEYYDMDDDEKIMFIEQIEKVSKFSFQLLENLLQWSRAQTGRIQHEPENIDLFELAEENLSLLCGNARSKKISLENEIKKDTFVYADKDMINTVIRNLITNAIKFTNEEGLVKIYRLDQGDHYKVVVEDNGIGMTQETMNKLFRIDVNITQVGTGKERGTGLGLILCKEFVEKNNGKVWIESELGKGTKLNFTLPKI